MEENTSHPYNTRNNNITICKSEKSIGKYSKPKFIVNVNKNCKSEENYKIIIGNLVNMSNRLLQRSKLKIEDNSFINNYEDDSDSDYIEEDKQTSMKYIKYSKDEKEYFDNLKSNEQKIIVKYEKEIKKINLQKQPIRFKILGLPTLSLDSKHNILQKLEQFNKLETSDNEYFKLSSWINWLDRLPFNKYSQVPITGIKNKYKIAGFLKKSKKILDNAVYGHVEAKDQIIINLAKMITNPESKGTCIAIQGPMGNGKTTLVKEGICKALNRPFGFVALGGMQDSNFMLGHDYTYEGSKPGKIIEILTGAGVMNPVIYFDELDKISETSHGEEISNLLCHLTDSSQNSEFQDKYLSGIKIDLSRVIFIFSYNDPNKINPILLDRMYKISTKGFKINDKINIAKDYLIPNMLKEYKLKDITFSDEVLKELINYHTDSEEGVRNLKRHIETIISKINVIHLLDSLDNDNIIDCDLQNIKFPLIIEKEMLEKLIDMNTNEPDYLMGLYS